MSGTTRLCISLPSDIAEQIGAVARATDRTASAVVRRALRQAFETASPSAACDPHAAPAEPAPAGFTHSGGGIGSIIERALDRSREQAADLRRVADDVRERNRSYLENLGNPDADRD